MPVLHPLHVLSWRTFDKSVCETKTETQKSSQCPNPKPRAIMLQCGGNRLLQEHGSDGFALPLWGHVCLCGQLCIEHTWDPVCLCGQL